MSYQLESASDITASMGRNIKKSIKRYNHGAEQMARSVREILDVEEIKKSLHSVVRSEKYLGGTNIVHKPIDWEKHPPPASSHRHNIDDRSKKIQDDHESSVDEDEDNITRAKKNLCKDSSYSSSTPSASLRDEYTRSRSDPGCRSRTSHKGSKTPLGRTFSVPDSIGTKISVLQGSYAKGRRVVKVANYASKILR